MSIKIIKGLIGVILLGAFFLPMNKVFAYVMSSTNYRIDRDSVNIGGLDQSTSANYGLIDTIGELATGLSESASYKMHAGYRQMDETSISLTVSASVDLSPNINGLIGGTSSGSTNWTVITDASAGYTMSLRAGTSPAMQAGSYNFLDYTPSVTSTPDYNWSIGSANSEFGFSVYNTESQSNKFRNDGVDCNSGSVVTDEKCWYGLSTSDELIVNRSSRTDVGGDITKINFQAEVNTLNGFQEEGGYTATIAITAVSN